MTYRILDLFCGAGGAAEGYSRAGFEVVGVDISPQPRYPFNFEQWDALDFLNGLFLGQRTRWDYLLSDFDAIHASPPCQGYSALRHVNRKAADKYPKLIEPTRKLLRATGLPYIIENVPEAPLENPAVLCGSMFDLRAYWPEPQQAKWVELRRHRLFETNWPLPVSRSCDHLYPAMPVYGGGVGGNRVNLKGPGQAHVCRKVMGIDWMRREELDEAIPPAYTEYVGHHLRKHLDSTSKARKEAA